jgi:hypothetical protein
VVTKLTSCLVLNTRGLLDSWWDLCGHMIPRAMLAVEYATGRATHARLVKGDGTDQKGYPGPPGREFGMGLTTPHGKKNLLLRKSNCLVKNWRGRNEGEDPGKDGKKR